MKITIRVKCVGCGFKKDTSSSEMPMCDKCFNPMIPESANQQIQKRGGESYV